MSESKEKKKEQKPEEKSSHISPSDIKGKIEIPDTRVRRDGPGGD